MCCHRRPAVACLPWLRVPLAGLLTSGRIERAHLDSSTARLNTCVEYCVVCGRGRGVQAPHCQDTTRDPEMLPHAARLGHAGRCCFEQSLQPRAQHSDGCPVAMELHALITWSYASMPSESSSTRWYGLPSASTSALLVWRCDPMGVAAAVGRKTCCTACMRAGACCGARRHCLAVARALHACGALYFRTCTAHANLWRAPHPQPLGAGAVSATDLEAACP